MRVAVVAEYYPREDDPVLGIWAHRQALAAAEAGVQIVVFVLERRIGRAGRRLRVARPRPEATRLDGLEVRQVPYLSPPRAISYAQWGWFAARALRTALARAGPFDLVHAHNAVPAGDAVLRAALGLPLVVSVHGGDVLWTVERVPRGAAVVRRVLGAAQLVLANSAGIERIARERGARETRVVHLGSDLPAALARDARPLIASLGHLVARKRHADVLRALVEVPQARYLIVGEGPERARLSALAAELGIADRVELAGQLAHEQALRRVREAWLFAMPSTAEAFGVAYIEAMAAGMPAIGCAGEPGPEEIAAAGEGMLLVPPGDPGALAATIGALLADGQRREQLGAAARATVERTFTWAECGRQTLAAYGSVTA
jgi:glycosyltransferase involved in cell wall biosynthesis